MASIRIGNAVIDNVEIDENGIVHKTGRRSRVREVSLTDELRSVTNTSLRRLMLLFYNMYWHSDYRVSLLDFPVLVEYVQKELNCSLKSAYNYAHAMEWIHLAVRGI